MASTTPTSETKRQQIESLVGEPAAAWLAGRREDHRSWRRISLELATLGLDVSPETLRLLAADEAAA